MNLVDNPSNRRLLLQIFSLFLFVLCSFIQPFDDEFEVMIGGRYLLNGLSIYSDYFSHHLFLPYYLSALLEWLSGHQHFVMRMIWSVMIWFLVALNQRTLEKAVGSKYAWLFLVSQFILIFIPHSFYFSLQSDSVASHFIITALVHLIAKMKGLGNLKTELIIWMCLVLGLQLSLGLWPVTLFCLMFYLIFYFPNQTRSVKLLIVSISAISILVNSFYLTSKFQEFYEQVILFNLESYSTFNHEIPTSLKALIRVKTERFLGTLKDFLQNWSDPRSWTFIARTFTCLSIILVFYKKSKKIALLIAITLILGSLRQGFYSNYHSNFGFHQLFLLNAIFVFAIFFLKELKPRSMLLIPVWIYFLLGFVSALIGSGKYAKEMLFDDQTETVIGIEFDPKLVTLATQMTHSVLFLPFYPKEQFYLGIGTDFKYTYLLPWHTNSSYCITDFRRQLIANPPTAIIVDTKQKIWGMVSEDFLPNYLEIMEGKYLKSNQINGFDIYLLKD